MKIDVLIIPENYSTNESLIETEINIKKIKDFFEKTLSRKIMTQEDFDKAHEAIAVLAKIYNVTKSGNFCVNFFDLNDDVYFYSFS